MSTTIDPQDLVRFRALASRWTGDSEATPIRVFLQGDDVNANCVPAWVDAILASTTR